MNSQVHALANGPKTITSFFDEETHSKIEKFISRNAKYFPNQTDQIFRRTYVHNMPFIASIHQQLSEVASEIFQETVRPSYSFLSMYKDGGKCPLHIDRNQCRYTIDYLVRQDSKEPWPISISNQLTDVEREMHLSDGMIEETNVSSWEKIIADHEWHTVLLNPNDAVCYSGTHSWHYRPFPSTGTADLIFFHFVPENYVGSLS